MVNTQVLSVWQSDGDCWCFAVAQCSWDRRAGSTRRSQVPEVPVWPQVPALKKQPQVPEVRVPIHQVTAGGVKIDDVIF